jgi:gliding motility-associated-like protein
MNGTVKVILRGIARLRYFRIYNRWGGMVFESTNIANGWDGTIGGVAQPAGVYVYEAEAVTSDGQIIQKQGNITLLK